MSKRRLWRCQDCDVLMILTDMDFMKCPICETEVWFFQDFDYARLAEQAAGMEVDPIKIPVKKGGGSKSSGRNSRKQLLKKKSTKQLYEELCR